MLKVSIEVKEQAIDVKRISNTMSLLLHEIRLTLFPETSHLLLIPCLVEKNSQDDSPLRFLPKLDGTTSIKQSTDTITLYFLEDSLIDMGMIKSLFDNLDFLFHLMADYLEWLDGDLTHQAFLCYGTDEIHADLNLNACRNILEILAPKTLSEYRNIRNNFSNKATTSNIFESKVCDFCGETVSVSSFEQLKDGRDRCIKCRDSAVDQLVELKRIFHDARKWMEMRFDITIKRNISVTFTSAEEIAMENGHTFSPTAGFDPRAVGFARVTTEERSIFIENGQPYHMTLGTVVHELTHIWQFTKLDMETLKQKRPLYIEGMAMWAEITCLQEYNIAHSYIEHEVHRSDEYGQGYREIHQLLLRDENSNPFALILNEFKK